MMTAQNRFVSLQFTLLLRCSLFYIQLIHDSYYLYIHYKINLLLLLFKINLLKSR